MIGAGVLESISISSNIVLLIENRYRPDKAVSGVIKNKSVLARDEIGDMAKSDNYAYLKPQLSIFF